MTNLEFYKDKILENIDKFYPLSCSVCSVMNNFDIENGCSGASCESTKALNWMLKEYKEPIQLKQWEYDTIKYHGKLSKFNDIHFLMAMKNKGYFKDMNSVEKCSMTIKEILENCEVVE